MAMKGGAFFISGMLGVVLFIVGWRLDDATMLHPLLMCTGGVLTVTSLVALVVTE
jgi:hypothetical protein